MLKTAARMPSPDRTGQPFSRWHFALPVLLSLSFARQFVDANGPGFRHFGRVAGQSVTVTAFVAMFASLFITQTIQATDRRYVVILFAVLLTLSCLLVSFANSFSLLLIGRACLGLALGGFWAMSASLTMRLVPPRTVPKALSVIFGAVSIALVIAAPLGSF